MPDEDEAQDYAQEIELFIAKLDREEVISEIGVLQSIYGDSAVRLWKPSTDRLRDSVVRYEVCVDLPPPHDEPAVGLRILVSLPQTYPEVAPPQLQLLSKYIGAFSVDTSLFGSVLRTFISKDGIEWTPGEVRVFDGVENVRERCALWYSERLSQDKTMDLLREDERDQDPAGPSTEQTEPQSSMPVLLSEPTSESFPIPQGLELFVAEPIVDRKSMFIGRACRITDPSQVPAVLSYLMSDRRIARAAHPIINAWRCTKNGVVHQDNDDDGESAAGGRLAHLLQILDVDHVLVVVTRYFGGIHLGPDRFKHINQAARNVLELGGFLDTVEEKKGKSRHRKRH